MIDSDTHTSRDHFVNISSCKHSFHGSPTAGPVPRHLLDDDFDGPTGRTGSFQFMGIPVSAVHEVHGDTIPPVVSSRFDIDYAYHTKCKTRSDAERQHDTCGLYNEEFDTRRNDVPGPVAESFWIVEPGGPC